MFIECASVLATLVMRHCNSVAASATVAALTVAFLNSLVIQGATRPESMLSVQEQASAGAVVVSLGRHTPEPGQDVLMPLSVSLDEDVKAGKIIAEIRYPDPGQLIFERAELSEEAKKVGGKLQVEKPRAERDTTLLKLTVTGDPPIPNGTIVYVSFKTAHVLIPGKFPGEAITVRVRIQARVWNAEGQELSGVTGEPGEVELQYIPPLASCFFYMH